MTVISDLLHPQYLFNDRKSAHKTSIKTAGLSVVFAFVSSLVFILTKQRTLSTKQVLLVPIVHVMICGMVIVLLKLFAHPSIKKHNEMEDNEAQEPDSTQSCCFGLCCPSKSSHRYSKVEDVVIESSHCEDGTLTRVFDNKIPSESIEMNSVKTISNSSSGVKIDLNISEQAA